MSEQETVRHKSISELLEKRAIAFSGTYTTQDFTQALVDGGQLLKYVNRIQAEGTDSVVPVLGTALSLPVGTVAGATGTGSDSTAVLAGQALTLHPWYSTLQVSMGAMRSLDFAPRFRLAMARAFAGAIDKMICVGSGSGQDGLGLFVASASGIPVASNVDCALAGAPKLADLLGIVSNVLALGADPARTVLVLNPAFLRAGLLENTPGTAGLQIELATRGTLAGVKVIASSYAPSATVAGSAVAVCADLSTYALAMAEAEARVDEIKTVGSDNVSLQSVLYMQGRPLLGAQARRLLAV